MGYAKPRPEITDLNAGFWSGCLRGELRMQKCASCGHLRYPVSEWCPECLHPEHDWVQLSGLGTVASYIVFHQVYNQAFVDDVPYNVALIQLDDGPRMFSNIVGVDLDSVAVGDRVQVCFEQVDVDLAIPRFRPVVGP